MSYAPQGLVALRRYLDAHLPGAYLGIVGDAKHTHGYHLGKDRLPSGDYSMRTLRDKAGLSNAAAAIDIGMRWQSNRDWLRWLVSRCQARAFPNIREVIGSLDGSAVHRWDAENGWAAQHRPKDRSHTWHTHISIYRDATSNDHTSIVQLFLEAPAPSPSEDPAPERPDWIREIIMSLPVLRRGDSGTPVRRVQGLLTAVGNPTAIDGDFGPRTEAAVRAVQTRYHIAIDGIVGRQTYTVLLLGRAPA